MKTKIERLHPHMEADKNVVIGINQFMNGYLEMKGWRSSLFWEGLPFLIPLLIFAAIAALNWDYEKKLISPTNFGSNWTDHHLGELLLGVAFGQASFASFILFIVRLTRPKSNSTWYMFVALIVVTIFLILPSLFIVILGPAAITMKEQMITVQR